jgi:hypothetical protein
MRDCVNGQFVGLTHGGSWDMMGWILGLSSVDTRVSLFFSLVELDSSRLRSYFQAYFKRMLHSN